MAGPLTSSLRLLMRQTEQWLLQKCWLIFPGGSGAQYCQKAMQNGIKRTPGIAFSQQSSAHSHLYPHTTSATCALYSPLVLSLPLWLSPLSVSSLERFLLRECTDCFALRWRARSASWTSVSPLLAPRARPHAAKLLPL